MVVHGLEGLDEISLAGDTLVGELKGDDVREYTVNPKQFGISTSGLSEIQVSDSSASKDMMLAALANEPGAARDILALNAGAAIYLAGLASSHLAGVQKAIEILSSGAARIKLEQFISFTRKLKPV
jgi:anthranilate phosphoribosyltransferase